MRNGNEIAKATADDVNPMERGEDGNEANMADDNNVNRHKMQQLQFDLTRDSG
jgi:hypothetical protein